MTDKLRAAAQQALDGLLQCEFTTPRAQRKIVVNAITDLRAALAEQPAEQEPVAWLYYMDGDETFWSPDGYRPYGAVPLYTAPQPTKQPLTDEELREALAEPFDGEAAADYCDTHCTWIDHAPGCERATGKPGLQAEPVAWVEVVVANLAREGVNKHRARELAKHFYTVLRPTKQPLTDEQIIEWVESGEYNVVTNDWASHIEFARSIEAAHGIGATNETD
jgi:hypothetical protein